ncbi:uncharacterized protein LOC127262621 [Andrographis paniculata]|uniref:uncharacterized protein LOC127262621 n=1 Tax=Andrographis paniculata TaxID=175694 RepID=UPI0021E8C683|nr:uncharacterized protein LOC127262621 [Andrographis paniculata]XP_051147350.1 uncharacterized protein LOC127262621 [Andrographis paniculata]
MGGGGAQSQTQQAADVAEEQYVKAKISVWWDIENCHVPKACDPHTIAQNISSALVKLNYCGPVSVSAYGDTTRISSSVQQALNSTGIALNHVPAGAKDASDKKILVDMLFWAVDNPAPANYLLISGDRDFSNALHQLRMRRYNILLAQPHKASAPLLAAAKSVWLWTSLVAGGPPVKNVDSSQILNNGYRFAAGTEPLGAESIQATQPMESYHQSLHLGNQKFSNMARGVDPKYKGKLHRRNFTQQPSMPRSSNTMGGSEEDYNNVNPRKLAFGQSKPFNNGTYNPKFATSGPGSSFVPNSSDSSWNNSSNSHGSHQNHFHPSAAGGNGVTVEPAMLPVNSSSTAPLWRPPIAMPNRPDSQNLGSGASSTYLTDFGKLNISEYSRNEWHPPASQPLQGGWERRPASSESSVPFGFECPHEAYNTQSKPFNQDIQTSLSSQVMLESTLSFSSALEAAVPPDNSVWGAPGCLKPSEYVQGLIGVIILALNTLKKEKIVPTEANITDCIRYGDPRHRNTDVKKALASAVEQQLVVKQQLGTLQMFVGKNEKLWQCVNPIAGNEKHYAKSIWDEILKFLSSSEGRASLLNAQCRYEAATVLKQMCLKEISLGEILQILHMVITIKKWIVCNYQTGWKPIKIMVAEINPDMGLAAAT